jgi:hypothetical protein
MTPRQQKIVDVLKQRGPMYKKELYDCLSEIHYYDFKNIMNDMHKNGIIKLSKQRSGGPGSPKHYVELAQ